MDTNIYLTVCHDIFRDFQYRHQNLKRPALILQSIAFSLRAKRGGYWKISQEGVFFLLLSRMKTNLEYYYWRGDWWLQSRRLIPWWHWRLPIGGAVGPRSWRDGLMSYEEANLGDKYVVRHRPYVKIRHNYYPFLFSRHLCPNEITFFSLLFSAISLFIIGLIMTM